MPEAQRRKIAASLTKPMATEKRCPTCGETKSADAFGRRAANPRYLRSRCRACDRVQVRAYFRAHPEALRRGNRRLGLRRVGATEADYERFFAEQRGRCAICGEDGGRRGRRLDVDHCYATGTLRGLLCSACNSGLGYFRDSPSLLRAAQSYLEKARP
jgi:hypothetical protein